MPFSTGARSPGRSSTKFPNHVIGDIPDLRHPEDHPNLVLAHAGAVEDDVDALSLGDFRDGSLAARDDGRISLFLCGTTAQKHQDVVEVHDGD